MNPRTILSIVSKQSPKFLLGFGLAGIPMAIASAVKSTVDAVEIVDESEKKLKRKLTPSEVVKETWKCYISTAILGIGSIGCILSSNSINSKRYAALASLYSISDTALKEYQNAVVNSLGEKKEKLIRDGIAQDHVNSNPANSNQVVIAGNGDVLCYDMLSGRYFKSNYEAIRKVENDINHSLINSMYVSLNEVYWALGMEGIGFGEEVGWNVDNLVQFSISSTVEPNTGTPCLALDYVVGPKHDYR